YKRVAAKSIGLLHRLRTLRNIFAASESELAQTPGMGMKRAARIRSLLDARHMDANRGGPRPRRSH
ncbi:MAG: hypothetical protein OEY99_07400, partial [Aigarchaeota archaeon]|nr:hypothetical protein [Aigarchaeota archaeon]